MGKHHREVLAEIAVKHSRAKADFEAVHRQFFAEILDAYNNGVGATEIARLTGLSRPRVYVIVETEKKRSQGK